ncbi:MAG: hypothetical protein JST54_26720 [Deltaproteobacteria bacterium]|nr:hypothetical protein [Deltaproteobacteria bacterium]
MRFLIASLLLLAATTARADDLVPPASSPDCKSAVCVCKDAETSSDCLDKAACEKFCERHDGVAEKIKGKRSKKNP